MVKENIIVVISDDAIEYERRCFCKDEDLFNNDDIDNDNNNGKIRKLFPAVLATENKIDDKRWLIDDNNKDVKNGENEHEEDDEEQPLDIIGVDLMFLL